ncbi:MAG: M23 family metallopeptidase [Bacteroidales bacterium]|nr:M23 family metallopeptidase [Bacteroidales bacterium]
MKLFFTTLYLCLFSIIFSQENNKNIGPISEIDTLIIQENIGAFYIPERIDNLIDVPAYELYLFWDTLNFNPYKTNIEFLNTNYIIDLQYDKFTFPVRSNNVSSKFGWRNKKFHTGIDISLKNGDTVFSIMEGKVRFCGYYKGYGNVVVIRHSNGLESVYAHLSKIFVKNNKYVESNFPIGLGGSSGKTTGPHLHFELRFLGIPIDPLEIIDTENMDILTTFLIINKDFLKTKYKPLQYKNSQSPEFYIVKKGDNLFKIARKFNTNVDTLLKINKLNSKTILRINQKIRIK